jgi:hypothetical protein
MVIPVILDNLLKKTLSALDQAFGGEQAAPNSYICPRSELIDRTTCAKIAAIL